MFLTIEELSELTGYVYCSRQIEWLRRNKWKFEITAQKRPKVARSYFELRLGNTVAGHSSDLTIKVQPNFGALLKNVGA